MLREHTVFRECETIHVGVAELLDDAIVLHAVKLRECRSRSHRFAEQSAKMRSVKYVRGGSVRQGGQGVVVHGVGRLTSADEIENVVVTATDGVPVRVGDVAEVTIGSEIRRGAVTADGRGEVVMGLGFMLMGENTHEVTWAMKNRLDEIKAVLPSNVSVEPVYDRTQLVDGCGGERPGSKPRSRGPVGDTEQLPYRHQRSG